VKLSIEGRQFAHAPLDCAACGVVHRGDDARFSPFWNGSEKPGEKPSYSQFMQHRFRHLSICVGRGCVRSCLDHLERTGRITARFNSPLIAGPRWSLEDPPPPASPDFGPRTRRLGSCCSALAAEARLAQSQPWRPAGGRCPAQPAASTASATCLASRR